MRRARAAVGRVVKKLVLIVCSDAENSRVIEEAASGWMLESIVCSSLQEFRALPSKPEVAVIFCEERLHDGTYRDLLSIAEAPVVVMISNVSNSGAHRDAIELGALDVVASPCSRNDVQWMVIRAMQDQNMATQ
jgi:DNA-binding NtrC family response regulator